MDADIRSEEEVEIHVIWAGIGSRRSGGEGSSTGNPASSSGSMLGATSRHEHIPLRHG
jgi:hypothetical protein